MKSSKLMLQIGLASCSACFRVVSVLPNGTLRAHMRLERRVRCSGSGGKAQ
jgi:hypothetical protein